MTEPNKTSEITTQPNGTYWHFLSEDRCLRYSDGHKVVAGETLSIDENPILCERGFHASERVIDALRFAPGPIVCLVTLGGTVLNDTKHAIPDKSVAQERTALWIYDATHILREFACDVAEEALMSERSAGREPDPRSFDAISVMRRFMTGDASETERNSAQIAAWSAARSTSEGSAEKSAWSASWNAGWGSEDGSAHIAAYSAARIARLSAAESAAKYVAGIAAESATLSVNNRLTGMLLAAMARGEGDFSPTNA